ncbi:DNA recombination protein RmuC [Patescibacteria group bacterium]|nr:DNA recombination protein RmuC [Patescibacteria group bacterium]MBU1703060.1 DNA recombination protein RmuC [Patescibacteria group bacterium]MBU1954153.1 DNA recombination protein RmuC [Patescibacteria group bacterium]
MDLLLTILGFALLAAIFYMIHLMRAGRTPKDDTSQKLMLDVVENLRKSIVENDARSQKSIQERFDSITESMNKQQHRSFETIQKQFGQSAKIIEEVTKKLTKLDETNKQVVGFAEQMKSLENILKNPKHRGILGEYFLESMLSSILPPGMYQMQYKFLNGEIVDAVIFLKDQLIPIDSKFSLEKFNAIMQETDAEKRERLEKDFRSDVKKRIDETSKYVRPEEKTMEFAFMYIPAEGVYHNLLGNTVGATVNSQNLIEYAFAKRVIIVSPSSFVAYLQTVLQGLNQMKMEEGFKEIQKNVIQLANHLKSHQEKLQKMGGHLATTVSMYNQSFKEFKKIDKDVYRITDGRAGGDVKEVLSLDKPMEEA